MLYGSELRSMDQAVTSLLVLITPPSLRRLMLCVMPQHGDAEVENRPTQRHVLRKFMFLQGHVTALDMFLGNVFSVYSKESGATEA